VTIAETAQFAGPEHNPEASVTSRKHKLDPRTGENFPAARLKAREPDTIETKQTG
jgi:hypothetical protein